MRVWVAASACLAGCNAVFGIGDVTEKTPDAPVDPCTLHVGDPGFRDEDGDGFDNGCDNCPGIYNPGQQDGDGDHVGDACDPHPSTTGDKLVAAEFFDGPTYSWAPSSAADWQLVGGSLVSTAPPNTAHATLTLTATVVEPTIELGFKVVTYNASGTTFDQRTSVTVNAPSKAGECRFVSGGFSQPLNRIETIADGSFGGVSDLPADLAAGQAVPWRFTFDHLAETCTINGTVEVGTLTDGSMPTLAVPITNATIQIDFLVVSLQYVLVYGTGA